MLGARDIRPHRRRAHAFLRKGGSVQSRDKDDAVIHGFYGAASGECSWAESLDAFSAAVGAPLLLKVPGTGCRALPMVAGGGIAPDSLREYRERFLASDPCSELLRNAPTEAIRAFSTLSQKTRLERTTFYSEWMAPQGFTTDKLLVALVDQGAELGEVVLSVFAASGKSANEHVQRLVSTALPHLRRALGLWDRVRQSKIAALSAKRVLDYLPMGVVMLDDDGTPYTASEKACAILKESGTGCSQSGGMGNCTHVGDLARRIRDDRGSRHSATGGGKELTYDYMLTADENEGSQVVFLFASGMRCLPSAEMLQARYGFSERESEMAVALCRGMTPLEAAETFRIAMPTVRTHIRRLLEKTGVQRQTELVMELLSHPSAVLGSAPAAARKAHACDGDCCS